jgi:hypothetical protein
VTLYPVKLSSPVNGAVNQPINSTLQWTDTNSSSLELGFRIRIKPSGGSYATYAVGPNTTSYQITLAAGTTYYWNVQAMGDGSTTLDSAWANSGVDWSASTGAAALNPANLSSPLNGAVGLPINPALQWTDTNSSPQEQGYRIRIKPSGGSYATYTVGPNTTSYQISLAAGTTYYWNVQAMGDGSTTIDSAWANSGVDWSASTAATALNPANLSLPLNGAVGLPINPALQWTDTNSSPQEQGYRIRIKPSGGSYATYTVGPNITSYQISLAAGTTYYWNVQAIGNGSATADSGWANSGMDWLFAVAPIGISGQVTIAGIGLSGVSVALSGSQTGSTVTDSSGYYAFTYLLAGGNYTVTTSRAGYSFVPSSQTFSNLSFNQTAGFVASVLVYNISGEVSLNGVGIAGVTMTLGGSQSASVTTDGRGDYAFEGLAHGGNYNISPSAKGYHFSPPSQTFNALNGNQTANFVALPFSTRAASGVSLFRNGFWFLDMNRNAQWDGASVDFSGGFGQPGDIPVIGDWNGSGVDKVGIFRDGTWFLDMNGNGLWDGGNIDFMASLGLPGDIPVVGDWDGSGKTKIGVFRNGMWMLDLNGNGQWDGASVDRVGYFGIAGDIPIVGDWDGSGQTKVGVFRSGMWFLDLNGNARWDNDSVDRVGFFGVAGDIPVVGDWDGSGRTKIGVFRSGAWYLDLNGNAQWDDAATDRIGFFGQAGDIPVIGDWDASGRTKIGVFRSGAWYLDLNGDIQWNGSIIDLVGYFGQAGDVPLVGRWR